MSSSLVHCIYTSCQTKPLTSVEVDALMKHSRENNRRTGITGVLFYIDGCFMQVLEGDPHRIDELYAKILSDPRHTRITRIILEAIPHRYFGEWTMGLATIGSQELAQILSTGDPRQRESVLSAIDEGRAKKLLRAFSDGRWRQSITTNVRAVLA